MKYARFFVVFFSKIGFTGRNPFIAGHDAG
jgi:hypothetical protein